MAKNTLLIIAPTFYPHQIVAAVRVTEWARHLADFGWKPVVLTRDYGVRASAEELQRDVHPEVAVRYFDGPQMSAPGDGEKSSSANESSAWRNRLKIGIARSVGRLAVPDPSVFFWRRMRPAALRLVDEIRPQAILTSSPPHSIHDLGLWLSRTRPEIPWVADFRDPYIIDARFQPQGLGLAVKSLHERFERSIYDSAALTVHAIPIHARWARRRYPHRRDRIRVLTNGFPPELTDGRIQPVASPPGVVSIRVMGMPTEDRLAQLMRSVERVAAEGTKLELRFIGRSTPALRAAGLQWGDKLVVTGQLPHREALAQLLGGDVLVNVLSAERSRSLLLSSKLFEFLSCGRPILSINPSLPDRQFQRAFAGVRSLSNPTSNELADAIRWALSPLAVPPREQTERFRREFSRRRQVEELAGWLNEL